MRGVLFRLGGTWHPEGWNGISGCRFIPHPCPGAISLEADKLNIIKHWRWQMDPSSLVHFLVITFCCTPEGNSDKSMQHGIQ